MSVAYWIVVPSLAAVIGWAAGVRMERYHWRCLVITYQRSLSSVREANEMLSALLREERARVEGAVLAEPAGVEARRDIAQTGA